MEFGDFTIAVLIPFKQGRYSNDAGESRYQPRSTVLIPFKQGRYSNPAVRQKFSDFNALRCRIFDIKSVLES